MYPIPPTEHLVETKTCKKCSAPFSITDKDMEFYEKVSPLFPLGQGGQGDLVLEWKVQIEWSNVRYLIPPPTLCPDCRQQRRLSFRNERILYKRKCDATWNEIISIYSPDKPYTVYNGDYWWSDAWDPLKYGRKFDFTRSAIGQMGELLRNVPLLSLTAAFESENSPYATYAWRMKDCYMVFAWWMMEKTLYSSQLLHTTYVVDSLCAINLELSYQTINCEGCFGLIYAMNTTDSRNSYFLYDCKNCSDCFLCYNLTGKKYHIENQEYSREKYFEKIAFLWKKYFVSGLKTLEELKNKAIKRNLTMTHCVNSAWDSIKNCNNCFSAFLIDNAQDCKYIENGWLICNNVYDSLGVGENLNLGYELIDTAWNATLTCFGITCYSCTGSFYNFNCHSSSPLFLCTWLRNASYCILNKQYTKEEYETLVPRIIEKMMADGEWGEFFPASMSPFGYNETVANEHYPMSREEVLSPSLRGVEWNETTKQSMLWNLDRHASLHSARDDGLKDSFLHWPIFNWSDYEAPFPKVEKIIPANKLPDTIEWIPDDILNWAIECEVTRKPFRIIKQELEFYRKHSLPIPRRHPDQRHLDRMKLRNPRKLFEGKCDNCQKDMITTYAPERPETVYCEVCYNKEVMW